VTIHTDPAAAAPIIAETIASANRVLILSHINPDGDAIGSMLGVWHVLRAMGKTATPLASSAYPEVAECLPGIEQVQVYQPGMPLPSADLVWMVDTASPQRVGPLYDEHAAELNNLPLIIVDHHVTNDGLGRVNLVDAQAASCAELLYRLFCEMSIAITPETATCLLLGLTTDTQSFQTNSTRPQTLRIAADLVAAGADQPTIVQKVYYTTPYNTVQMLGMALSRLQREDGLIWTSISHEMMQQTHATDSAYDEVTSVIMRIDGMQISALFKEREDGTVKLSLRSKAGIDVAQIARTWGGGGHTQAAGATIQKNLDEAQREVLAVLRERLNGGAW
jgi:phosphoesterase RecJ-like protein